MSPMVSVKHFDESTLQSRLEDLERRYGMSTPDFLERWTKGELDGHDYVLWAGLSHLAIRTGHLAAPHASAVVA